MKMLFISQPMNGRHYSEICFERDKIASKVRELTGEEVYLIDSVFEDEFPDAKKNRALQCLGKSLELMADADIIYFTDGWENARGCKIEHDCARAYGIPIIWE